MCLVQLVGDADDECENDPDSEAAAGDQEVGISHDSHMTVGGGVKGITGTSQLQTSSGKKKKKKRKRAQQQQQQHPKEDQPDQVSASHDHVT